MIYQYEVEDMIIKLNRAGAKVTSQTHAIYASKGVEFDEDVYPLEIIVTDDMPDTAVCIIAKKDGTLKNGGES